MDESSRSLLCLSKSCSVRRLTASGVVTHKPSYVFLVSSCPDNGGLVYEAAIHNGETSSGEILIDIKGLYGQNKQNLSLPIYFNRGIYLALTANMESITIQYLEEGR